MKIVLIGSGNVATVLGKLLKEAGHMILQVFSRSASSLASELSAEHTMRWSEIRKDADLYLVALSDKALLELPEVFLAGERPVVHTAGSVSRQVLEKVTKSYGVFYPLQSLRKEIPLTGEIPILVDANEPWLRRMLIELAKSISSKVHEAGDEERFRLHIAAVFINNFTNHLYALAESFCKKEQVPFQLLYPLIEETARRVMHQDPAQLMTGPAIRGDSQTIEKHLQKLEAHPELKKIYQQLTASIQSAAY